MPTSKKTAAPKKRSYHHGDLRRALIDAAWALLREGGLRALTLREVARAVGVTHAAPYHHFPTHASLLDALAEDAFVGLEAAMRLAKRSSDDAGETMFRIGRAYTDFARERPEQLLVMFRARNEETDGPRPESLAGIGARAFAQLFDAVCACQAEGLAPKHEDAHQLALAAWSWVHGFSMLWAEGPLTVMPPYSGLPFEVQRDTLVRGMLEGWKQRALAERRATRKA